MSGIGNSSPKIDPRVKRCQRRRVGVRAFLVVCVGVVVPFLLGTWLVGPLLLPGLSTNFYLFLGG